MQYQCISRSSRTKHSTLSPTTAFLYIPSSTLALSSYFLTLYFYFTTPSISAFFPSNSYFSFYNPLSPTNFLGTDSAFAITAKYFFISSSHTFEALIVYSVLFVSITFFMIVFLMKFT